MNISITQFYELLSEKVGKETAESVADKADHLASKADLANAKTNMIKWFVGLYLTLALMIIGLYFKS